MFSTLPSTLHHFKIRFTVLKPFTFIDLRANHSSVADGTCHALHPNNKMLKITAIDRNGQRTLVLEGRLADPWLADLEKEWTEIRQVTNGRDLLIDLKDVTSISDRGELLLRQMMVDGAKFNCCRGVLTRHVLRRLAQACTALDEEEGCEVMKAFATGATAAVQHARSRASEYATADEFCEIFSKNTESLYTLALALTADESKAEECFVSALQKCQTSSIFKQWAHSWSRLAVIESAIRIVRPTWSDAPVELAAGKDDAAQGADPFAAQVLRLAPFERFAFVLSLLDRYSVRDCAILLKCRPREIQRARQRAIEFLSTNLSDSVRPDDARLIA